MILQLVQQGKLSLDVKLSQFEPQIPNASNITIRELLNHTSGLQTNAPSVAKQVFSEPEKSWTPQQVIAADVALPPLSSPGAAYHYSDTGYVILGQIATKVMHTDIGRLIQRQVLAPLGLHHTAYAPGATIPSPSAHGYLLRKGRQIDTTNWSYSYASSAGSMASTLGDLKIYAPALATGDGLLGASTQQQRLSFVSTGAPGLTYGLGILKAGDFLGHDGEVAGYTSIMLYAPALHVTIVVLGNTSPLLNRPPDPNGEPASLATQLLEIAQPSAASGTG